MKVRFYITNGMVHGRHEEVIEIDESEMEYMNEEEREAYLHELSTDFMNNIIDYGFEVLDD